MPDYKTIAKNIPGISEQDLRLGEEGLRYLRNRTQEKPFFAIATGSLHSGPISYNYQQKYVEKIVKLDPYDMTNETYNNRVLYKAQFWRNKCEPPMIEIIGICVAHSCMSSTQSSVLSAVHLGIEEQYYMRLYTQS